MAVSVCNIVLSYVAICTHNVLPILFVAIAIQGNVAQLVVAIAIPKELPNFS